MKKFLTIFLLVLASLFANAQQPILSKIDSTSAVIKWNKTGAIKYVVSYNDSLTKSVTVTPDTFVTLSGLKPGKTYKLAIANQCSPDTNFTTLVSVPPTPVVCNPPDVNFFGTYNLTSTSFKADWNDVTGATKYNIRIRVRGTTDPWIVIGSSTISEFPVTGLTPNTKYEWQVQTVCGTGLSAYSPSGWTNTLASTVPPTPVDTTTPPTTTLPVPDHIVMVWGENMVPVVGNSNSPYITSIANQGANLTNYYAITHPSQPNYIQVFSGGNQGVTNDTKPTVKFNAPNLAKNLIVKGKTYVQYCEGLPAVGSDIDVSGRYYRKHNPLANFVGTGANQVPTSLNQPFTAFPTDYTKLPTVAFVVPDICGDGHDDCTAGGISVNDRVKQYDTWIQNNLNAYKNWCINNNSILIISFDENDGSSGNKITCIIYGAHVKPGTYIQTTNHYSALRMIEEMYGLPLIGASSTAPKIDFCWK
jgi:hypothetical protein